MADALGTGGGVVSDEDHRLATAGMIASQTSTLAVRTGVMHGPSSAALVTGTTATGTMTVNVLAHHWVTTRGTADGVYLGTKEASTTVNIAAAPAADSRIDVVWSKQNDAGSTISPDATTGESYGVTTGTVAVSPTKPAIPVGAVEIATVTVAAGATNTLGAGVTIANTARLTVARGAPIPVRNAAERDALTTFPLLTVYRLDTGSIESRNAADTAWGTVFDPSGRTVAATGRAPVTDTTKVLADTGITAVVTVPAPVYPVAVPWRLVLIGTGKMGFDSVDRDGSWDIDSTPASATNVSVDATTGVRALAAAWATVGVTAQMDLPAGVEATFRLVYRGNGPAYNTGGVVWHRTTVV